MYATSGDGEYYYGEFATKEEAIKDGCKEYVEQEEFYVGEITHPKVTFDHGEEIADQVIDYIQQDLDEIGGEFAECFCVSEAETASLAEFIENAVRGWIEFRDIQPGFILIENAERIRVPDFVKGSL